MKRNSLNSVTFVVDFHICDQFYFTSVEGYIFVGICTFTICGYLSGVKMEWCNDGEVLAVAGFVRLPNLECSNALRFYTAEGYLRYTLPVPHQVELIPGLYRTPTDKLFL